jgi:hypothetical protein
LVVFITLAMTTVFTNGEGGKEFTDQSRRPFRDLQAALLRQADIAAEIETVQSNTTIPELPDQSFTLAGRSEYPRGLHYQQGIAGTKSLATAPSPPGGL